MAVVGGCQVALGGVIDQRQAGVGCVDAGAARSIAGQSGADAGSTSTRGDVDDQTGRIHAGDVVNRQVVVDLQRQFSNGSDEIAKTGARCGSDREGLTIHRHAQSAATAKGRWHHHVGEVNTA